MTLHAIAIDDEPLALEVLANHAQQVDFVTMQRTFGSAEEGIAYLQQNKTDILFLDIKMPDISGLDIAAAIPENVQIVFTTAYAEYAVNGFELGATDYLLKPISLTRFAQACNRALERRLLRGEEQELYIKDSGTWHKLQPADLLYIEAQGNYLKIVSKNGSYLVRKTLHEFEPQLPDYFARTHKSFIINIRHIERLGQQEVTIGFKTIPLSTTYRKALSSKLGLK